MRHPFWLRAAFGLLLVALFFASWTAWAVGLGKMEVGSHLGEPFYAEIPLLLDKDETLADVFVELASPSDYRILELYRDPAVSQIQVDIKRDNRGARVELSSQEAIASPFFNLVIKLRHGRATYFRKYPVFLDLPKLPVKQEEAKTAERTPEVEARSDGQPFGGWARVPRYGPIVKGDTLYTIARRLRVDRRFTIPQVMVALFKKNKEKFEAGNINVLRAGAYLDVPSASEVKAVDPREARRLLKEHQKRWETLKRQPHFAEIEEAQRTRYKKKVTLAKQAVGEKSPIATIKEEQPKSKASLGEETVKILQDLREENRKLKAELATANETIQALLSRPVEADLAAANARIKRLELQLARLQAQLDEERKKEEAPKSPLSMLDSILILAIVLLLGMVLYLMRQVRKVPPSVGEEKEIEKGAAAPLESGLQPSSESSESIAQEMGRPPQALDAEATGEDVSLAAMGVGESGGEPIDHLTEAEVYLRYGMEEEAINHVRMAIQQDPKNPDAWIKLIHILHDIGDLNRLEEACKEAETTLTGEGLQRFKEARKALPAMVETETATAAEEGQDESEQEGVTSRRAQEMRKEAREGLERPEAGNVPVDTMPEEASTEEAAIGGEMEELILAEEPVETLGPIKEEKKQDAEEGALEFELTDLEWENASGKADKGREEELAGDIEFESPSDEHVQEAEEETAVIDLSEAEMEGESLLEEIEDILSKQESGTPRKEAEGEEPNKENKTE